ncbi:TRAP transporter small permease subunit [Acidihalobacter ferrooxydans]|uniref:TRAP transporter small permease protein n=1 Tax=Acidihalobacter ferrooxydans TaxID=1765967 RepID=A0A1P8UJ88_9GAMM|nr:TRAP transporter small permease subunit [Acidihalobacter ferrooxydans]APZ43882.1 C4-dicarboxylate ABC transporter substrate-binding protein [Acidihalobacter ferrooxydans]
MRAWLKLASGIDALNERVGQLMYWLAMLMILIGVYNATVRYLGQFIGHNLSSNAYLEAQWYLFGTMFMLGAAYTLKHNAHVRVDIFYNRLSARGQAWVELLGTVFFLLPFSAMVFYLSLPWVEFSWKLHEISSNPGGLPRYPIKTVVPIAFVLLFLQGVSQLIKAIAVIAGQRERVFENKEEGKPL